MILGPQQLASTSGGHQSDETGLAFVDARPVHLPKRMRVHVHAVAGLRSGLRLVYADPRDFRVGEHRPWRGAIVGLLFREREA